jgi:hypothetical protein
VFFHFYLEWSFYDCAIVTSQLVEEAQEWLVLSLEKEAG